MENQERSSNSLTYDILIKAKPEQIWAAITNSEGTRATLFGSRIESTFEPGARIEFRGPGPEGDDTLHVYGFVRSFRPFAEFAYEQHPAPAYNENHETVYCDMTFKLTVADAVTTRLELTCVWTEGNPGYEHAKTEFPASSYMDSIKSYAESLK
ncbi:SRPBCC domain-containing protein [Paenibacillus gorillae]|uniref:SRPBCC domain-containing protein n=1 Tax=Paenibacillus gorillae TaxID=1243662 RepID=UPI0004B4113D|nr:SRPBCC domain-containing protein [Paenibacillus gorillae]